MAKWDYKRYTLVNGAVQLQCSFSSRNCIYDSKIIKVLLICEDYLAEQNNTSTCVCHKAYFQQWSKSQWKKSHWLFIKGTTTMLTSWSASKKTSSHQLSVVNSPLLLHYKTTIKQTKPSNLKMSLWALGNDDELWFQVHLKVHYVTFNYYVTSYLFW